MGECADATASERAASEGGLLVGTDGSGGQYSACPVRRREGWGVAVFATGGRPLGGFYGSVPNGAQTVPRAELMGLFVALKRLPLGAGLAIVVDAAYVFKGWHRGSSRPGSTNLDLWNEVWRAAADRLPEVEIVPVRSHLTPAEAAAVGQAPEHHAANAAADALAERAAREVAISPLQDGLLTGLERQAAGILQRLVAVAALRIGQRQAFEGLERSSPVAPRERPLERKTREAAQRGHVLRQGHAFGRCLRCFRGGPLRTLPALTAEPCTPAAPAGLHASHQVLVHRGLQLCVACGAWAARRLVGLAKPCSRCPTIRGRQALEAVAHDRRPPGLLAWPDKTR